MSKTLLHYICNVSKYYIDYLALNRIHRKHSLFPLKMNPMCFPPEKLKRPSNVFKGGDSYSQRDINVANLSWLTLAKSGKPLTIFGKKPWHVSTPNPRKTSLGQLYYNSGQGTRSHNFRNETSVNCRGKRYLPFLPLFYRSSPASGRLANIANFLVKDTYVFGFVLSLRKGEVATWPFALCLSPFWVVLSWSTIWNNGQGHSRGIWS